MRPESPAEAWLARAKTGPPGAMTCVPRRSLTKRRLVVFRLIWQKLFYSNVNISPTSRCPELTVVHIFPSGWCGESYNFMDVRIFHNASLSLLCLSLSNQFPLDNSIVSFITSIILKRSRCPGLQYRHLSHPDPHPELKKIQY